MKFIIQKFLKKAVILIFSFLYLISPTCAALLSTGELGTCSSEVAKYCSPDKQKLFNSLVDDAVCGGYNKAVLSNYNWRYQDSQELVKIILSFLDSYHSLQESVQESVNRTALNRDIRLIISGYLKPGNPFEDVLLPFNGISKITYYIPSYSDEAVNAKFGELVAMLENKPFYKKEVLKDRISLEIDCLRKGIKTCQEAVNYAIETHDEQNRQYDKGRKAGDVTGKGVSGAMFLVTMAATLTQPGLGAIAVSLLGSLDTIAGGLVASDEVERLVKSQAPDYDKEKYSIDFKAQNLIVTLYHSIQAIIDQGNEPAVKSLISKFQSTPCIYTNLIQARENFESSLQVYAIALECQNSCKKAVENICIKDASEGRKYFFKCKTLLALYLISLDACRYYCFSTLKSYQELKNNLDELERKNKEQIIQDQLRVSQEKIKTLESANENIKKEIQNKDKITQTQLQDSQKQIKTLESTNENIKKEIQNKDKITQMQLQASQEKIESLESINENITKEGVKLKKELEKHRQEASQQHELYKRAFTLLGAKVGIKVEDFLSALTSSESQSALTYDNHTNDDDHDAYQATSMYSVNSSSSNSFSSSSSNSSGMSSGFSSSNPSDVWNSLAHDEKDKKSAKEEDKFKVQPKKALSSEESRPHSNNSSSSNSFSSSSSNRSGMSSNSSSSLSDTFDLPIDKERDRRSTREEGKPELNAVAKNASLSEKNKPNSNKKRKKNKRKKNKK